MQALSSAPITRTALARIIDHTLLRPEATPEQVVEMCEEALDLGVGTVCVSPSYVRLAAEHVGDEVTGGDSRRVPLRRIADSDQGR